MTRTLLKVLSVVAVAIPMIAAADPVYTDTQPYQVESKYPYVVYPTSFQLDNHYAWETKAYTFDPNVYYYPYEQQQIIQSETTVTHGTVTTESNGSQSIGISQGAIPEATQQNVPAPVERLPSSDQVYAQGAPYNKSYYRTESFGNNIFGAGYALNASVTATEAAAASAKRVDAFAEGQVFATAFNAQKEIIRGRVEVHGQESSTNSGTASLFLMGQQVWTTNLYYTYSPTPINWSRTFFSASKTFMVGPVPITVAASLSGGLKLTVTGEIGPTVARLTAQPGGWANVTASASVNIIIASFGIEGSLTLINVTLPATGELFWPYCTINWTLKTSLNLNTLAGNLKLFAKINFIFFSKKWTVTIASWNGLTYNWTLLNQNGTKDLGICMFMGPTEQPPLMAESR